MGTCWEILEIEPTEDERSIKRAYAKKLKIVHPEDDPDGFKHLRAAYERALHEAPWINQTWDEDDYDDGDENPDTTQPNDTAPEDLIWNDAGLSAKTAQTCVPPMPENQPDNWDALIVDVPEADPSATPDVVRRPGAVYMQPLGDSDWHVAVPEPEKAAEPPTSPAAAFLPIHAAEIADDPAVTHFDDLYARIEDYLSENPDAPGLPADFAALLASPLFDRVDVLDDYEGKIADLVSHNMPASQPLIAAAAARFNWKARVEQDWREEHGTIAWLVGQLGLVDARLELAKTPAGRALLEPPKPWALHLRAMTTDFAKKVQGNREKIEMHFPGLEQQLNPQAVAWWDNYASKPRIGQLTFWFSLLPMLLLWPFALAEVPWQTSVIGQYSGTVQWTLIFSAAFVIPYFLIRWPAYLYQAHGWENPRLVLALLLLPLVIVHMMIGLAVLAASGVVMAGHFHSVFNMTVAVCLLAVLVSTWSHGQYYKNELADLAFKHVIIKIIYPAIVAAFVGLVAWALLSLFAKVMLSTLTGPIAPTYTNRIGGLLLLLGTAYVLTLKDMRASIVPRLSPWVPRVIFSGVLLLLLAGIVATFTLFGTQAYHVLSSLLLGAPILALGVGLAFFSKIEPGNHKAQGVLTEKGKLARNYIFILVGLFYTLKFATDHLKVDKPEILWISGVLATAALTLVWLSRSLFTKSASMGVPTE